MLTTRQQQYQSTGILKAFLEVEVEGLSNVIFFIGIFVCLIFQMFPKV
jgi:hypothetical protein